MKTRDWLRQDRALGLSAPRDPWRTLAYRHLRRPVWPRRYVGHYGPNHRAFRRARRAEMRRQLTPGARYEPCPFHHLRRRRGDHLIRMGVR